MAKCDEGYLCDVCGQEVEQITDSDLYLRYILGEIPLEQLHRHPERHIRCHPSLAQFIVDPRFEPLEPEGMFHKSFLDSEYVEQQTQLVTLAWRRLQYVPRSGWTIAEYPFSVTPLQPEELTS